MSRQSTVAQKNLTLTEELEKLEQSITLTLQEIDHNFSKAHRIVTTSILPIVDQYAEHSKNVWEGSKFWKQFFEASANVSLSGYEEPSAEDEAANEEDPSMTSEPSTSTYGSPPQDHDQSITPQADRRAYAQHSYSPSPNQATPRARNDKTTTPRAQQQPMVTAPYSSPYENLKRDLLPDSQTEVSESDMPSTPRAQRAEQQDRDGSRSSPFAPPSTAAHTARRTPANDVLLHRVLDKNWRVQATPHTAMQKLPSRSSTMAAEKTPRAAVQDDNLDSSPAIPAPELHAEIFGSPERRRRTPGVSVLTPGKKKSIVTAKEKVSPEKSKGGAKDLWDSDDEEDGFGAGMSPPKTMQFHIPQARLIKTPAREASKRIVEDILQSAGGNVTDDLDEDSPSVVRRGGLLEEDTF